MNRLMWVETFKALSEIEGLQHAFVRRVPEVDVEVEKDEALRRLQGDHDVILDALGMSRDKLALAEQVHGCDLALCSSEGGVRMNMGVDGLLTEGVGVSLGIYVADCCAVYLVDEENRACALLHSGKCGTELEIVPQAIELMRSKYDSKPQAMIAQLSPCIRPPWYEQDFAETIRQQCALSGLRAENIHDPGTCTAEAVDRYYSYRREEGKTGRMLALLGWQT